MSGGHKARLEARIRDLRARAGELGAAIEAQNRKLGELMAAEPVDAAAAAAAAAACQVERDRLRREQERRLVEAEQVEARLPAAHRQDGHDALAAIGAELAELKARAEAAFPALTKAVAALEAAVEPAFGPAAKAGPLFAKASDTAREYGVPVPWEIRSARRPRLTGGLFLRPCCAGPGWGRGCAGSGGARTEPRARARPVVGMAAGSWPVLRAGNHSALSPRYQGNRGCLDGGRRNGSSFPIFSPTSSARSGQ